MKYLILYIAIISCLFSQKIDVYSRPFQEQPDFDIDVLHYDINLNLYDHIKSFTGKTSVKFKIGLTIKGTYIEQDANAVFFQVDGEQQIPQVAVSKQLDENKFLFKKSHIELVKIDNGKIIFDANTPKDKEPIIYDPKTGEIIKN